VTEPAVGAVLGARYALKEVRWRTKGTVVYEATLVSIDRQVLVELLVDTDSASRERFMHSARVGSSKHARVDHVIAPMDLSMTEDGLVYIAREHSDGLPLAVAPRNSGKSVIRRIRNLGLALDALHVRGLVLRQLDPTNIIVEPDDTVRLYDFRFAQTSEGEGGPAAIANGAYTSQEQGLGEWVDRRTDIYALGVILYEQITGSAAPIDLEKLPESMASIVARATAPKEERYASAGELVAWIPY